MSNLPISPMPTVSGSQGSDKVLSAGANNAAAGSQDSDFNRKLVKALNSHPSNIQKPGPAAKEKNLPDSKTQAGSSRDLGQGPYVKQEASKASKSTDDRQSNPVPADDHSSVPKAAIKKHITNDSDDSDDSNQLSNQAPVSDEKAPPLKNKHNSNDASAVAVSPSTPVMVSQPVATQTDQPQPNGNAADEQLMIDPSIASDQAAVPIQPAAIPTGRHDGAVTQDHSAVNQAVASDPSTANSAVSSIGTADNGNIALDKEFAGNNVDPLHDLNSGTKFLKQLMSSNDAKELSAASAGNPAELSILQNNVFQSGTGGLSNNTAAQQTPAVNNSNTGAAAQPQALASAEVAIAGNALPSSASNQPLGQTPDKAKSADNLQTTAAQDGKSVESQTPITALKTGDQTSPAAMPSKDAIGAVPMKQDSQMPQPSSDGKGSQLGDSLTADQAASKGKNGQSLNLPVIQTQLSVNNQSNKTRTNNAAALSVEPPHTADAPPQVDAAAGTAAPVNKDDLFAQIVEKAKVSLNHGNREMEVNLKPDHLGKLHLKISVENQLVTAKFVAESQQVKEIIETNLNQLRRNLQDNGIQVDQLMVSVGQQHSDGAFQHASHNFGGFAGQQPNNSKMASPGRSFSPENKETRPRRVGGQTAIDLIA